VPFLLHSSISSGMACIASILRSAIAPGHGPSFHCREYQCSSSSSFVRKTSWKSFVYGKGPCRKIHKR
jgi:hypothetical protein